MEGVEREQVLAFRLASHNLTRRLDQRAAVEAAPCGIQETPLGSAAVAFAARVEGLTPAALEHALAEERALVTPLTRGRSGSRSAARPMRWRMLGSTRSRPSS